ncbi:hypothetical protein [Nitrosomonas oligotropha]|uniref:hypothetical protein n=1 Tax=Nitrosomonas oligotropha TaxID=42354 RepID=UPI0013714CA8|nr:hypothetical protein [Nitrosomonas oligotropha]MXS83688.1 hypothetical protein [Nitrosomonas oligotropha]
MNNLTATKNDLENLQQQDDVLSAKLVTAESEQKTQRQEFDSATASRDVIEKRHIMDMAGEAEVIAAKQLCDTLEAKLATTNRRIELIKAARSELVPKIEAAQKAYEIARREHLQLLIAELSQNLNAKLRGQLLEVKAAETFTGIEYGQDWSRFLARIFPAPELTEIVQAQDKFCQTRKFNR